MKKKKKTKISDKLNIKKLRKIFWLLFGGGLIAIILMFFLAAVGAFGELPTYESIENPESVLATEVISDDGKVIGNIWQSANRSTVKYEELSPYLVKALIATEDERFEEHSGIDFRSTFRAFAFLGSKGGASTITQQLAKQLFTEQMAGNKVVRGTQKLKEWIISVDLERQYTKREIITMYFNTFDFLYNAHGIKNAANTYFGKTPTNLTLEEAAVLVGMAKNPILYNPIRNPKNALARRNTVLEQMERNEYISLEECDSLKGLPITTEFHSQSHTAGLAQHFREYIREAVPELLKDVRKPDGGKYSVVKDGLRIYTTIDSRMQKYAEEAVEEHMPNLQKVFDYLGRENKTRPFINVSQQEVEKILIQGMKRSDRYRNHKRARMNEAQILKEFNTPVNMQVFTWAGEKDTLMSPMDSIRYYKSFLNTGLLAVNPQDGHVKAWVGSINYKYFMYDHVIKSARQVGSTFKPFVYATAIDQLRMSPCDRIVDQPYLFKASDWNMPYDWSPRNSEERYSYRDFTLTEGLAKSMNTITAAIVMELGTTEPIRKLARNLGVTSDIPSGPSMCLGTTDISLYEMVGAYSTFVNKGTHIKPIFITRIEDKNGLMLYQDYTTSKAVLSEESAYVILKLLEGVTRFGSGVRLRTSGTSYIAPDKTQYVSGYPFAFTNPIAGKTGTTQNQSDGWFIGMVPNLVTGVWVGCEDRSAHFRSITYGQGATMALPVWGIFMKKCYADPSTGVSSDNFSYPSKPISINLNCSQQAEHQSSLPLVDEDEMF